MSEAEANHNDQLQQLTAIVESWEHQSTEATRQLAAQLELLRERIEGYTRAASGEAGVYAALAERDARIAALEEGCTGMADNEKRLEEALRECEFLRQEVQRLQQTGSIPSAAAEAFPGLDAVQAFDDSGQRKRLGTILLETGLISEDHLEEAITWQRLKPHQRLGALIIERGYTSEEAIARIIAAQCRLPFENLRDHTVNPSVPALINAALARKHTCVPIRRENECLVVAMSNPMDLIAIEDIERATGSTVRLVIATPAAIEFTISRYCHES